MEIQEKSDCGKDFAHDPHLYVTDDKTKACDGQINKDVSGRSE